MGKVNLDILIASLLRGLYSDGYICDNRLENALEDQGLKYEDGKIVEIKPEKVEPFRFKEDYWYMCYKDWKGCGETYTKGKVYLSDCDRCLVGNSEKSVQIGDAELYFRPATEKEVAQYLNSLISKVANEPKANLQPSVGQKVHETAVSKPGLDNTNSTNTIKFYNGEELTEFEKALINLLDDYVEELEPKYYIKENPLVDSLLDAACKQIVSRIDTESMALSRYPKHAFGDAARNFYRIGAEDILKAIIHGQ